MLQFLQNPNLSNEKKTGCLSYIGITSPGMALQVKSTGCLWDLQQKQNFPDLPHVRRVLLICQTQMIRLKAEKQKKWLAAVFNFENHWLKNVSNRYWANEFSANRESKKRCDFGGMEIINMLF